MPVAMVPTKTCANAGPVLSFRVTGPFAPVHVIVKGTPFAMPVKLELVNWTFAAATARVTQARRSVVKCMLDN